MSDYGHLKFIAATSADAAAVNRLQDSLTVLDHRMVEELRRLSETGNAEALASFQKDLGDWDKGVAATEAHLHDSESTSALERLAAARLAVNTLALQAVDLARKGNLEEASNLLESEQFRAREADLAVAIHLLDAGVAGALTGAAARARYQLMVKAVGGLLLLFVGVPVWIYILRTVRQWQAEITRTVSELADAQLSLRADRDIQRTILDSLVEGIVACDSQGHVILYNRASEEILRQEIELPAPESWSATYHLLRTDGRALPEEEVPLNRALRGEIVRDAEVLVQTNGASSRLALLANAQPITDASGRRLGGVVTFHDVTDLKKAEHGVRRQLRKIAALHQIDMAITSSLDMRLSLNVVISQVIEHLEVDAAQILLLDEDSQTLTPVASHGFLTDEFQRVQQRLGEGFPGLIATKRETFTVTDFDAQPTPEFVRRPLLQTEQFHSYCGTPLIAKGSVRGVLEAFRRRPSTPDQEWVDFFKTLAGQAAIAVDSAHLFESLQKTNTNLRLAYDVTLEGWVRALDLRDKETEGHSQRVTSKTVELARSMGISGADLANIRRGALLHDIGKLGVPDSILLKPGKLTDEDWVIMKLHPVYAYEWLSGIEFLRPALDIPYCHHERWDGTGYPRGLKGEDIPLAARIFAIVDVWDALRSDRPYRKAWSEKQVYEYLKANAGSHFDPDIVEKFLEI